MSRASNSVLSALLSLVLAMGTIPAPALAEMADELDAAAQEEVVAEAPGAEDAKAPVASDAEAEPSVTSAGQEDADADGRPAATGDDGAAPTAGLDAEAEGEDVELVAQATGEDPFCFVDVETGQRVTTLHTTGTYQLVSPDGTPYAASDSLYRVYFEYLGTDPRGRRADYSVSPKVADTDGDGTDDALYLEDLTDTSGTDAWQLPTGAYRIYTKGGWDHDYFQQRYRVINDGLYYPEFDLTDDPSLYYEGSAVFHVKPYTAGKSDHDYDQRDWHYVQGDSGDAVYEWITPDQQPFLLASDTRISFLIDTAVALTEDNRPQLERIALWKADEPLETLVGTYDEDTGESAYGAYARLWRDNISRVPAILAEAGFDALPTWPTYLNFMDDSKLTTLWERGGESLDERIELDQSNTADGDCTSADVIIDHANFADVAAADGIYFPVVTMSLGGETYTYAYHPIQVDASSTSPRNDPRITTASLKDARVGDAYAVTLKGKSGAPVPGDLTWVVTDGTLPAGLALDAATGTISGTPTAQGEQTFTVTLTETIEGEARTATRSFALNVRAAVMPETAFADLSLGEIGYQAGAVWPTHRYNENTYINLRIPITLDLRDERYDLAGTELWYMLKMTTAYRDEPLYYVFHERAVDLMSEDGTTLEVAAPVEKGYAPSDPTSLIRIRAFLIPKTNDGSLAFDPGELADNGTYSDGTPYPVLPLWFTLSQHYGADLGDIVYDDDGTSSESQSYVFVNDDGSTEGGFYGDYAHYVDYPEMPYTALERPNITFGGWLSFSAIRFEGSLGDWPTQAGRIRIWPYDGTTTPTKQQVKRIGSNAYDPDDSRYHDHDGVFKLAPGTYAFVVEGEVPVYDENGVETAGVAYVDIADKVTGARAIPGTSPQQFLVTVEPGVGSEDEPVRIDLTFSGARIEEGEAHSLEASFELEDGSYGDVYQAMPGESVDYQAAWYRRTGDDESSDVLVATGDYVMFGSSQYDLYVEVTPTGRGASFWKPSGKVKVSDKNKSTTVRVPRKRLFRGTFVLSCASGKTPEGGDAWGILEVRTPLLAGGFTSYNVWAYESLVTLPDLTAGSVVTFTPSAGLDAGSVAYTVPEEASAAFAAQLVAPLPAGIIGFEGLHFTGVDGMTTAISLDDGSTEVQVERMPQDSAGNQATEVPFYQSDGTHIVLQPERYYGLYFQDRNVETTYRVTVTHRDPAAPTRLGGDAADYAARQAFEVTLAPEQPSATIPAATLVSRGYATIPVDTSSNTACTLLLYDAAGTLVDKDATVRASAELRTPFLDQGAYTLYAVDANLLGHSSAERLSDLRAYVLDDDHLDHGSSVDFTVADGAATDAAELAFPSWEDNRDLIDHANSSVSVSASYDSNVSITMHAQLADGVELTDDAYLEVSTNQPSGVWGEGYMSPRSLSMNGKTLRLNRWENLFGQTQCMGDGSLRILLAEARKLDEAAADFPLDMTLVIPRTQTAYTEASVWLVSNGGRARWLVGTSRQESHDVSLVVPPTVAWQSFYVHGETGPKADVVLYLNGMRVATTRSDSYGYYSAEITLPANLLDYSGFSLQAMAQWATAGGDVRSATSAAQEVTYTTSFPVVERITMCYQSSGGDDIYHNIVTYYRGKMPDRYASVYRSENERHTQGKEHAKDFWLVEFSNGDGVSNVTVSIPRATAAVELQTTDVLETAESWIDDVRTEIKYANPLVLGGEVAAKSDTGQRVRDAFMSDEVHAFVTEPTYLTYAASAIDVAFEYDGEMNLAIPMQGACDLGRFEGYRKQGVTKADVTTLFDTMAEAHNVWAFSPEDVAGLTSGSTVNLTALRNTSDHAQRLLDDEAGRVDEWFLLGSGTSGDDDENVLLKVHHEVTTTDLTRQALRAEVQGIIDDAQVVVGPYEEWLYSDKEWASGTPDTYKGDKVTYAGGQGLQDESTVYLITTVDDDNGVQVEMLRQYLIEGTDTCVYDLLYMDKGKLTRVGYDEANCQRVEVTYTIDEHQVEPGALGIVDLCDIWYVINATLCMSVADAAAGMSSELTSQAMSADAPVEDDDDSIMTAQGVPGEVVGTYKGWTISYAIKRLTNNPSMDTVQQLVSEWKANWDPTSLDPKVFENYSRAGSQKEKYGQAAILTQYQVVEMGSGMAGGAPYVSPDPVSVGVATASITTPQGQAAQKAYEDKLDSIVDIITGPFRDWYETRLYREYKYHAWRRRKGLPYDKTYFYRLANERPALANKFKKRFDKEAKSWEKTHSTQNGKVSDPSGIVYEAVLSNPVEGATVKLYTFNPVASNYGLDPAQFVDSTQFGIEDNPQTTAADGRYQWFVPSGYWQVRVSKKGYESYSTGDWGHEEQRPTYQIVHNDERNADEYVPVVDAAGEPVTETVWVGDYGIDGTKTLTYRDAYGEERTIEAESYWMPVLPIQLDVNIPLVSLDPPEVAAIEADENGVTVTFTKYVKPDTVTTDLFAIDGSEPTAVEAADAEAAGDGSGTMLARTYRLSYPADMKLQGGDNNVSVAYDDPEGKVTSYADVVVADDARHMSSEVVVHVDNVDVAEATVARIADQTYTGKALTPTPTVTLDGVTLAYGTDYTLSYEDNTNAGTATVIVTGAGAYTGTKRVTFVIKPADISKATIASIADQGYLGSGKQVKPTPKVTLGGKALASGTDFTVSYKGNAPTLKNTKQTASATVTITGRGNYTGTKSAKFTIKYKKPSWSGASKMPAKATASYTTTNGGWIRIKSGKTRKTSDAVLSVSGKTVTAKKKGTSTLVLLDPFGTEIATKTVTVFEAHGKTYEFESSVDKSYVLDIQGGSKKDGAQMIVYKRNGGDNQRYQLYLQKDGSTYAIRSKKSGKWLTVESKGSKYVQQWAWKGGGAQTWRLTVDASNRVTFVNVKTSKCFDVQGGKTKNSAKMIVWQYNGGLNQKWKLNQK